MATQTNTIVIMGATGDVRWFLSRAAASQLREVRG